MTEESGPAHGEPIDTKEAVVGSGGVRKGADMLVPAPTEPVAEPTPLPMNMAPATPPSSAEDTPAGD